MLDHFTDINKMVQIGSGAERKQQDYELTRYAYLLDSTKFITLVTKDYIMERLLMILQKEKD